MDVEFRRLFRPFGRHKIPAEIIRPNSSCAGRGVAGQTCQCAPSGPIRGARDSRGRRCECPRRPCLGPPFFLMASRYFAICCPEMVSRRLSGGDGVRPAAFQLTVSRASAVFPRCYLASHCPLTAEAGQSHRPGQIAPSAFHPKLVPKYPAPTDQVHPKVLFQLTGFDQAARGACPPSVGEPPRQNRVRAIAAARPHARIG